MLSGLKPAISSIDMMSSSQYLVSLAIRGRAFEMMKVFSAPNRLTSSRRESIALGTSDFWVKCQSSFLDASGRYLHNTPPTSMAIRGVGLVLDSEDGLSPTLAVAGTANEDGSSFFFPLRRSSKASAGISGGREEPARQPVPDSSTVRHRPAMSFRQSLPSSARVMSVQDLSSSTLDLWM